MRKWMWIFLCILLVLFLPQIASLKLCRGFFNQAFSQRFHAETEIETIHLSWFGPQKFENISLKSPQMEGHIDQILSISCFWRLNASGQDFIMQGGEFTFSAASKTSLKNVSATVKDHDFQADGETLEDGQFHITGKIFSSDDFDITYNCQKIPTVAIDQLWNGKNFLDQILGSSISASGSFVFNQGKGAFSLTLSSSHLTTKISGNLENEYLLLDQPLELSFALPPELGKELLGFSDIEAKNPIFLQIDPQGFRFPWRSFDLKKIVISSGSLDMGQIICQTEHPFSPLISLFQKFPTSDELFFWFTPVSFSLSNGTLQTARMDTLISSILHICTWGSIDLPSGSLNMTLGICADTLTQMFGIKKLPRNYVMKIPLRGSIENPQLDSKPVAGKIAAFLAAEQVPKIRGKVTDLFGGTLHRATQSLDNQDNVPPAKRPFPWE